LPDLKLRRNEKTDMIEITNTQMGPIQIVVRSKRKLRAFTTMTIPGRGSSKNKVYIEDESVTDYIQLVEKHGLISTRRITE
jgi:hypothetical protein